VRSLGAELNEKYFNLPRVPSFFDARSFSVCEGHFLADFLNQELLSKIKTLTLSWYEYRYQVNLTICPKGPNPVPGITNAAKYPPNPYETLYTK
jgi:hypothetical protein